MGLLLLITAVALGYAAISRQRAIVALVVLSALGAAASIIDALPLTFGTSVVMAALNSLSVVFWFWIGRGIRYWKRQRT